MCVNTVGKIKGYVKPEDVLEFIRERYDEGAEESFKRETDGKIANISWEYRINEHSDDDVNEYVVYGSIYFYDGDDLRSLFYCYGNVNHMDNAEYYREHGLVDMAESESTNIFLKYWGNSVDIIKEIVEHFGGGWIDDNDGDEDPFYRV